MWLEVLQFFMVCVRWCVLCQAAGQRQRAHSVRSGPQRVRSAAVSNITTSSTVAPSLIRRCGRWRRARCLFVCFFVERQLWGSTSFRRHSGLTCRQKQTRKEMWSVPKMCVAGGCPVALVITENDVISCPGSHSATNLTGSSSLESCRDGITTTIQHQHQLRCHIWTLCSLECSYVHQLPLESSSC